MAIDPYLVEAKWKSDGLTKRKTTEKIRIRKTGVSEALRAYAAVANLGVSHAAQKQEKLKAIKTLLTKARNDHPKNPAFVNYVGSVELGLAREVNGINDGIQALTLDAILNDAAEYTSFHRYCTDTEHNPEPLEFLHDVHTGVAAGTLIATYLQAGVPKEINIDASVRRAWVNAPASAGAKKVIVDAVALDIKQNELPRYKRKLKITV